MRPYLKNVLFKPYLSSEIIAKTENSIFGYYPGLTGPFLREKLPILVGFNLRKEICSNLISKKIVLPGLTPKILTKTFLNNIWLLLNLTLKKNSPDRPWIRYNGLERILLQGKRTISENIISGKVFTGTNYRKKKWFEPGFKSKKAHQEYLSRPLSVVIIKSILIL